ncbi:MAG: HAMP domain-containing protein, partial [Anaerolineae bacterium]|nr:HAMP domain-containing protein [Anaerolineae bacterium]
MTDFLRRLSVRQRIFGGFVLLILLAAASLPVFIFDHNSLNAQLQQVVEVDAQAERLLLSAAVRVASSRANLLRYLRDTVPSPYEAADDVVRALDYLAQAQVLLDDPVQQQRVRQLIENLNQYTTLIEDIQVIRATGDASRVTALELQSQRLGNDIGVQIERVVVQSQQRVAAANAALNAQSQQRLLLIIGVMVGALVISVLLALVVERSISRPVMELRVGAESFARGNLQTVIPVAGSDELSLLAQTFNRMAGDLAT